MGSKIEPTHICRRDHRGWRGAFVLRARTEHCEHVEAAKRRAEAEAAQRRAWEEQARQMPVRRPARAVALISAMTAAMMGSIALRGRR